MDRPEPVGDDQLDRIDSASREGDAGSVEYRHSTWFVTGASAALGFELTGTLLEQGLRARDRLRHV